MEVNKVKKHGEFYTCKRYRLYTFLSEKGFFPIKTITSPNDGRFNWWIYKNNIYLEEAISDYFTHYVNNSKKEEI